MFHARGSRSLLLDAFGACFVLLQSFINFVLGIMIAVGNFVFLFDECSIVVVGHTFSLRLGLRSGSSCMLLSLICVGCLPVKLRSSTLKESENSMFHVRVCLLCKEINLKFVSIICALW